MSSFEFGWNSPKKVEVINRGTQQTYLTQATPKEIIKQPYGFREQDIIHSLCLVLGELVDMQEAQFQSQMNRMNLNLTKESTNAEEKGDNEGEQESDLQDESHEENQNTQNESP